MPTLNIDLPPKTENISELYSYLYRLVEKLNIGLNNLDDKNMNSNYQNTIKEIVSVSDKAKQLAELLKKGELASTGNVRDMYKTLRDSVFASMDNITVNFNSLIEQTRNEIKSYVEANYIASNPDMTLDEKISSMILQTAEQIRIEFNTLSEINADAIGTLALLFGTYFRFSEDGMEVGKIGEGASPVVAKLTNEQLQFIIAGTNVVLAYFDGATNKLKINMAEIDSLSLGNDTHGYIDFDMTANGLFIKWRS